jgi:hypothetical protein
MRQILTFNVRFVYASIDQNRWLRWFLEAAFVVVAVGLISVLGKGADPLMPFGITALDLTYLASLGALLFVLALVFVSVIGIPLFRYNGVLLMLAGIGVFEYQVYEYMKLGWWQPFPLRDFTDALFLTWTLDQPISWPAVLLRNFLEETAVSIFLIAIGALWHVLANKFLNTALDDIRVLERETLAPAEELPAEQAIVWPEPANAETFDEGVPTVAEPIVLAEAKLMRAKRPTHDAPIAPSWLADERRDAGTPAGVYQLDSRRKPTRRPTGK